METDHVSLTYDAAAVSRILGLPCECSQPVPQAAEGEIVLYYGGWSLKQLRTSATGKKRMRKDQDWYDDKCWKAEPGYYRLLLRVPDSNRKNWSEQVSHLRTIDEAWQPAPVCVAATALLVHLVETGNDLLKTDVCRCAEALPDGDRVVLTVYEGRVDVSDYWDDHRNDDLWLSSACRKS